MEKTFYITTPIFYPTAVPHIGTAYTVIAADILSRWHSLQGRDVFFLTGTDEHGRKIQLAAEKEGKNPQDFVNSLIPEFKKAWKLFNIGYDRFIRTTDKDHEQAVRDILQAVYEKGDIYKGNYEGFYCTGCEAYYTEKDLQEGCCPVHKTKIEKLKEESYFFKLSKYQRKLLEWYQKSDCILPEYRKREVINRIQEGLQDLSISRTSFKWGITLPFDENHVCYVWFDALVNYLSGIGYPSNQKLFKQCWPADLHLVGKDILWFHAVIWPAILFSLGIDLPKQIFAHGWLTIKGEKMGKSAGNAIDLLALREKFGADAVRYVLFREAPFGEDGEFSESVFIERYNNELANKLGNLVSRVSALAEIHGLELAVPLPNKDLLARVKRDFESCSLDKALNSIFGFVDSINEYVQKKKPWETKDKKVLWQAANGIKDLAILLSPFMPETSEKIAGIFNFELSLKALNSPLPVSKISKAQVMFRKIDKGSSPEQSMQKEKLVKENPDKNANGNDKISYDEFSKLDMKVGKILKVKDHPNADKLYILEVDLGQEKRTIVAGLKNHYEKAHLEGKKAIFAVNLKATTLRGVESDGMILAAVNEDDSHVVILIPDEDIAVGSKVR